MINFKISKFSELNKYLDSLTSINFNEGKLGENYGHYYSFKHFHTTFREDFVSRVTWNNFFTFLINLISYRTKGLIDLPENNVTQSIPKGAKYYMFSAHDTTLVSILSGIHHKGVDFPVYASSIVIELRKEKYNSDYIYTMRWFYNDQPININNMWNNQNDWNPTIITDYLKTRVLGTTLEKACDNFNYEASNLHLALWFILKLVFGLVSLLVLSLIWAFFIRRKCRRITGAEIVQNELKRLDLSLESENV